MVMDRLYRIEMTIEFIVLKYLHKIINAILKICLINYATLSLCQTNYKIIVPLIHISTLESPAHKSIDDYNQNV